jgi:alpha-tubulin suppressor-like RCC1 family protein
MALVDGRAWGWTDRGQPVPMRAGVRQVGVSQDAHWVLQDDGRLLRWGAAADTAAVLMTDVSAFACGQSGWFAIDAARELWHSGSPLQAPRRVAQDVVDACIGDGADYHVRRDGTLWVRGLAHRGQYGDGRLTATADFVQTASDAVAVRAHTGHALYLSRSGMVMGTGGNRFGPLGAHGLGDKADAWGRVFEGAKAMATGSRHSAALRTDGTLWAWGGGFGIQPRQLADRVVTVAAGNSATVALRTDGSLLQWDGAAGPRRLRLT